MTSIPLSFVLQTNDPAAGLGFELRIDGETVIDITVDQAQQKHYVEFADSAVTQRRCVEFILKNKTADHTQQDEHGNFVKDAVITVSDIEFDGIVCDDLVHQLMTYTHDFNGSAATVQQSWYGTMGCNGTARLDFSTPLFVWLLDNM